MVWCFGAGKALCEFLVQVSVPTWDKSPVVWECSLYFVGCGVVVDVGVDGEEVIG